MQRLVADALTVESSGPGSVELPIAAAAQDANNYE